MAMYYDRPSAAVATTARILSVQQFKDRPPTIMPNIAREGGYGTTEADLAELPTPAAEPTPVTGASSGNEAVPAGPPAGVTGTPFWKFNPLNALRQGTDTGKALLYLAVYALILYLVWRWWSGRK